MAIHRLTVVCWICSFLSSSGRLLRRHIQPQVWEGRRPLVSSSEGPNEYQEHRPRRRLYSDKSLGTDQAGTLDDVPLIGDERCPCAHVGDLEPVDATALSSFSQWNLRNKNITTYGIGCKNHDVDSVFCESQCNNNTTNNNNTDGGECPGNSWCFRAWCWVDAHRCNLLHRKSFEWNEYNDRYFSYATCRNADILTRQARIDSLRGTRLRVGLNSNSGGWKGAYSSTKTHFDGPLDRHWHGPLVEFLKHAAAIASFDIVVTPPPSELEERAHNFFGSNSSFDYCIYATALGYLDLCLSEYRITTQRASSANFYVTEEPSLHLVSQEKALPSTGSWKAFQRSAQLIFQPFTTGLWIALILFVVPCMAMLMMVHEYGQPGSEFPQEIEVLRHKRLRNRGSAQDSSAVSFSSDKEITIVNRNVPIYRHCVRSVYATLMSIVLGSFGALVVTTGGKLQLLGISFLALTLVAVYTANLAAILTQNARTGEVVDIAEARKMGYRFCIERKTYPIVSTRYDLPEASFVADTDGRPGFESRRDLVLDRVDVDRARNGDISFCHAAIAIRQDLEIEQSNGRHCDKKVVGLPVGSQLVGFPIFDGPGDLNIKLQTLFANVKNSGKLQSEFNQAKPQPQCQSYRSDVPTESMTMSQLTGIWAICCGCATLGLVVMFVKAAAKPYREVEYHTISGFDQAGRRVDKFELERTRDRVVHHFSRHSNDSFVTSSTRRTKTPRTKMGTTSSKHRRHRPNSCATTGQDPLRSTPALPGIPTSETTSVATSIASTPRAATSMLTLPRSFMLPPSTEELEQFSDEPISLLSPQLMQQTTTRTETTARAELHRVPAAETEDVEKESANKEPSSPHSSKSPETSTTKKKKKRKMRPATKDATLEKMRMNGGLFERIPGL